MDPLLRAKAAGARAVGRVARLGGFGGTSLPGKVFLRLQADGLARLAGKLEQGCALITATNGKTTTTALAAAILCRANLPVLYNRSGANMAGGIATTLLEAARGPAVGLFEVDEFWLPRLVEELKPKAVAITNLLRDQLDRYGELELVAKRWAAALGQGPGAQAKLVLCADDPLVAALGLGRTPPPYYFGLEDPAVALPAAVHAADAKHCRSCGTPYHFNRYFLAHLGHYSCPRCGAQRPKPTVWAQQITVEGVGATRFLLCREGEEWPVRLPLPGLYNLYNALAATTLAVALGVALQTAAAALCGVEAAFGRAERIVVGGREVRVLLVKNPAGASEVVRTVGLEPGEHDLLLALNDRIADGRDVSWIWDAELELLQGRVGALTCSGARAAELALRLKYAGVEEERMVVEPDLRRALALALQRGKANRPLYALPTYTAMLELRKLLGRSGRQLGRGG